MTDQHQNVVFDYGIEDRMPLTRTTLFGFQHLLALTGIWIFPVLIGQALSLTAQQTGYIIQACFLTTGLVTILQSGRFLKLPVVQGPTAAFFVAVLAAGQDEGLGVAFGSMVVAALIFMLLSVPVGRMGLMGNLIRYISPPIVYGTLMVIIGAQLASIGLQGWFGTPDTPAFGVASFITACLTVLIILSCMTMARKGLLRRGALLWGIIGGSLIALLTGISPLPDTASASAIGVPKLLPFGFGVSAPIVALMLLAFLQAGAEAMGMYTLLADWGGQPLDTKRVNRGLFTEFLGSASGALFGGLGTTSYPENVGIIRLSRVGSRFVTLAAGVFAVALSCLPQFALFIAGLPGAVLSAASTVLFGTIAISGIQMLARIDWDEYNIAVAAPSFIISLGTQFLPQEVVALFPDSLESILTQPMMVGIVLLMALNYLVNFQLRPMMEKRKEEKKI
ncbi:uracil-xanthine permease family protein [Kushneria aurantia]|uniref:Uracil-xanthine permease family protein n=1 Tax=Kushneria aurantia TaxID=504092 RepID=A0ABV6G0A8_9GAMM|nr:solute carrier family 23 protein [Kushneria aurantia]